MAAGTAGGIGGVKTTTTYATELANYKAAGGTKAEFD
jgi:hypothetical protein